MWGSFIAVDGADGLGVLVGPAALDQCAGAGDGSLVAPVTLASGDLEAIFSGSAVVI